MKNLLLINRYLTILLLLDTYAGSIHDKRLADAHLYPLPAGSWLLQDLGFLGFSLPNTEILAPFKKPISLPRTFVRREKRRGWVYGPHNLIHSSDVDQVLEASP